MNYFCQRNGGLQKSVFFDFVYEPMVTDGAVQDIMVLAI